MPSYNTFRKQRESRRDVGLCFHLQRDAEVDAQLHRLVVVVLGSAQVAMQQRHGHLFGQVRASPDFFDANVIPNQ